jgi:predicted tellurium resistance membrane protein TerC
MSTPIVILIGLLVACLALFAIFELIDRFSSTHHTLRR